MGNSSTQTVQVPQEKPREGHSASNPEPDRKGRKPRFSVTIVSQVPV
jgi:hypothetical protein